MCSHKPETSETHRNSLDLYPIQKHCIHIHNSNKLENMELNLIDIPHEALDVAFFQVGWNEWLQPGWIHEKTVPYGIVAQARTGEYEITCSGQTVRVKAPEAFLTPAHQPMRIVHHVDRRQHFAARWLHFSFVLYQTIDLTSLLDMPLRIDSRRGRELGLIMQELIQCEENTEPLVALNHSIRRRELMWRVLRIVCEASQFKADAGDRLKAGQRLAPLLAHLNHNLTQPISVSQMAEMVNMSPSSFYAFFRKKLGCRPMEYAKRIRLDEAASQFSLTDRLLKEVAANTGFANPFHLSREFKRRFGLSPKQYRALHFL